MNITKYIILSIIDSLLIILPVSYSSHIFILQNTFNTKIFDNFNLNSIFNLSLFLTIIIIYYKNILKFFSSIIKSLFKKNKTQYKTNIKYLKLILISCLINTIIYSLIPHKTYNYKILAISYILTALFLFSSTNKKGERKYTELTYFDSILIGLSSLLTFIPSISPLCATLFICAKQKIVKSTSLKYSFICYLPILLLNSIPGISYIITNQEYLIQIILCIFISIFICYYTYNYFKYIYYTNQLYKLSIYCIILTIFLLFWFR